LSVFVLPQGSRDGPATGPDVLAAFAINVSSAFVDVTVLPVVVICRGERRGVFDRCGGEGSCGVSQTASSSTKTSLSALLLLTSPNTSTFVTLRASERLFVGVGDFVHFRDGEIDVDGPPVTTTVGVSTAELTPAWRCIERTSLSLARPAVSSFAENDSQVSIRIQ